MNYAKGTGPVSAKYARGGDVITTRSRFFKNPENSNFEKSGKGGALSKLEGETKKLPTVKPRS